MSQFLLALARRQPTVLLLDDLHWADRESLHLLGYVARYLSGARLLLIGAYRETELNPDLGRPLGDLLPALSRDITYEQLPLRGLTNAEVAEYIADAGHGLTAELADAVHAETLGNPFYVGELVRHLLEHGVQSGRVIEGRRGATNSDFRALGVPRGVRQVLRSRLARLSLETRQLLGTASAFTAGFNFSVLQAISSLTDEQLLACLDEALGAGLISVVGLDPPRYDFVHAIVRRTIYEEINPDRRARLHRRVAEALSQVGNPSFTAEIAAQYHASVSVPGAEAGVPYALAAAETAQTTFASERAVQLLRIGCDLAHGAPAPARADVLTRLALAEAEALQLDAAPSTIRAALSALAECNASTARVIDFLTAAARALKDAGTSPTVWEPLVDRGVALLGNRRDLAWARLELLRDRYEQVASGLINATRWLGYDPEAVAIAQASDDEELYARTLEPFDWRSREETDYILALARRWRRPAAILRALAVAARDSLLVHGDMPTATERAEELLAAATQFGSLIGQADALTILATTKMASAEWTARQHLARRTAEIVNRLGPVHRLHVFVNAAREVTNAYYLGGDWAEIAPRVSELASAPAVGRPGMLGLMVGANAALSLACAGNTAMARTLLATLTPVLTRMPPTMHHYHSAVNTAGSVVWELDALEFASSYRRLALTLIDTGLGYSPHGSSELTAARMAALLGDAAEAGRLFALTRERAGQRGELPVRAMADYDEALAMARRGAGDRARMRALFDEASAQFRALGMDMWAQRAQSARDGPAPAGPSAERARAHYRLTPRELEVLVLIAAGSTTNEIAEQLALSPGTVERHITSIYDKIGARSRADATAYAFRHGLT